MSDLDSQSQDVGEHFPHNHGPTAALLDPVWCRTCFTEHIATIPQVTFACVDCGFGSWTDQVAGAHAVNLPDHIVYPEHHATVRETPDDCPACARDDRCCSIHRTHVSPHRGCILR